MRNFSIFFLETSVGGKHDPVITDHASVDEYNEDINRDEAKPSLRVVGQVKIEGAGADILNAAIALTYDTQEMEETILSLVKQSMKFKISS